MHVKFEINQTKIEGSCQSERKVVTHKSKSDLPLKSSQSKDYGIGHKKNFNKLLKSVVKAKKHPDIGCMP